MKIFENFSLQKHNTFNINQSARYFAEICTIEELGLVLDFYESIRPQPFFILGDGSNILFTKDFDGLMVKMGFKGIEVVKSDREHVWVKASAGENWDDFVAFCVDNGWGGIENLSYIPGTVGAAPVQNIGAYGVEIKDFIEEIEFLDLKKRTIKVLRNEDCQFGYRDSIFKHQLLGKVVILSVCCRLNLHPQLKTGYGDIQAELADITQDPNIKDVRKAIINIRKAKLPEPAELGCAGSFFKNPVVTNEKSEEIRRNYPFAPCYPVDEKMTKLSAAWLIDQCNWKGVRRGDAGVHKKQALVLVNYGYANGSEILSLAQEIQASVLAKFGVKLDMEVNIL
jgi:UDP-N-acetylmuramate dehydrogenase